ncbi:UNVERIFIED_CONTAM: hypothetical protein PYX00_005057 [Menopon gallinae]|uniref:Uncharacterized protein n=1 Tax=Menopon gallinae TaxID=328185 RepID=A0AAW2HRB6_9NEOP
MSCCNRRLATQIFLGVLQGVLILAQGSLLNYYIISHFSSTSTTYFFFLGDFVCIFIFVGALTVAYRYLVAFHREEKKNESFLYSPKRFIPSYSISKFGVLPMVYLSWAFYALLLVSKIAVIFSADIPNNLNAKDVAGPQLLRFGIALAGIVFFILVEGHNWAEPESPRYVYVNSICLKTGIEILDSVSFLTLLVTQLGGEPSIELTPAFCTTIIVISSINFLLPILMLYKLSLGSRNCLRFPVCINVLHSLLHICLIDIPFLCVRLFLWIKFSHNASMFMMKNVFGIMNTIKSIHPDVKACCRSDPENRGVSVQYFPSKKILRVDEGVGEDGKISEQVDELRKINSSEKSE